MAQPKRALELAKSAPNSQGNAHTAKMRKSFRRSLRQEMNRWARRRSRWWLDTSGEADKTEYL